FVELEKDIYPQTEVGCVNEGSVRLLALLYCFVVSVEPACSSGNDRNTQLETSGYIVECSRRDTKIYGYIGSTDVFRIEFIINFCCDLVLAGKGNLFYHFSHFTVSQ